jgi:hypothetical protein
MNRLDVVGMIVPPFSAHPTKIYVVRNNVVIIRELSFAESADAVFGRQSFCPSASASRHSSGFPDSREGVADHRCDGCRFGVLVFPSERVLARNMQTNGELGTVDFDGVSQILEQEWVFDG